MKKTNPQKVIAAHNEGRVNLRTMTAGQVCMLLTVGRDSVTAAKKELGIRTASKTPHRDDGHNAELLRTWKCPDADNA